MRFDGQRVFNPRRNSKPGAEVNSKTLSVPTLLCPSCAVLPAGEFCAECRAANARLVGA